MLSYRTCNQSYRFLTKCICCLAGFLNQGRDNARFHLPFSNVSWSSDVFCIGVYHSGIFSGTIHCYLFPFEKITTLHGIKGQETCLRNNINSFDIISVRVVDCRNGSGTSGRKRFQVNSHKVDSHTPNSYTIPTCILFSMNLFV